MAQIINIQNKKAVQIAAETIKSGDVIIGPTDTLYGMLADASNEKAVEKLVGIKKRHPEHALPLIGADLNQVVQYAEVSELARDIANAFWPGPLTIILPLRRKMMLSSACIENNTIAVRVPANDFNRAVARLTGSLITATSTNFSGERPAGSVKSISPGIKQAVNFIFDDGPSVNTIPSTILRLKDSELSILRQGPITEAAIRARIGLNL